MRQAGCRRWAAVVERPRVGAPAKSQTLRPANTWLLQRTARLVLWGDMLDSPNGEGKDGRLKLPTTGEVCDSATVSKQNCWFPWGFESVLSPNALRHGFFVMK